MGPVMGNRLPNLGGLPFDNLGGGPVDWGGGGWWGLTPKHGESWMSNEG